MADVVLEFQNGNTQVVPQTNIENIQLLFAPFIRGEGITITVTRSKAEFDAAQSSSILHWIIRV